MQHGFVFWVLIGAVAGWLAGTLMKGGGFGLLMDIVLGVAGAFIGGWLAGVLGIHIGEGWLGSLITATGGALLVLFATRLVKRA
ncbi:GlsB/YeaQ/YmgE family stress response membrane protein [Dyella japonica]|uniref:Membrane protein YeaQ/YmgE (Transglycosylase-associated protein family) n=1 Tax=Dyella japonica TaxID=231455 RepID=A0ABV2JY55_9GAMM